MAADPQVSSDPNLPRHSRDYEKFINVVKWSMLVIAIIAAFVIYIISN